MVGRLLEKRALKLTSFDVFATDNPEKPLDLVHTSLSSVFGRKVFRKFFVLYLWT
jgi:hypothetical protein